MSLGCPLGQGYLFSRPLGVDAMEMFLAADATRRVQEGDVAERDVTSAKPGPRRRRASSRACASSRASSPRGPGRQNGFRTINQTSTANPTKPIPASASGRRVSRIRASSSFETGAGGGSPFLSFIDGSPTALRTVA